MPPDNDVIDAPAPAAAAPAAAGPAPAPADSAAAPAAASASAPAAPAPGPAASPAQAPAAGPAEPAAKAEYPDDWRQKWAGEDAKLLKRLERIESPAKLAQIIREQDLLIRQDRLAKPLAADATPEQITEWRAERGIPDKPEGYELKFDDGLVVGENEQPGVDAYLKAMHATNATPDQVKAGARAFLEFRDQEREAIGELDASESSATEEALREEWGGNYKPELARIEAMFSTAPQSVKDAVFNARSGRSGIMNNVDVVKFMAGLARELNPTATIVPAGGNREGAIDDERKAIEAKMYNADGSNNPEYWGDAKLRDRYSQLLSAGKKANG